MASTESFSHFTFRKNCELHICYIVSRQILGQIQALFKQVIIALCPLGGSTNKPCLPQASASLKNMDVFLAACAFRFPQRETGGPQAPHLHSPPFLLFPCGFWVAGVFANCKLARSRSATSAVALSPCSNICNGYHSQGWLNWPRLLEWKKPSVPGSVYNVISRLPKLTLSIFSKPFLYTLVWKLVSAPQIISGSSISQHLVGSLSCPSCSWVRSHD